MTITVGPITLADEAATADLAHRMAHHLYAGDCLLLAGPIGAGKTTFARALIRALLANPREDVPSPTFTLVQTYDAGTVTLWHADLYRLSHPDEAAELGLEEAFDTAICLVEWPDRLGSLRPTRALLLDFAATAAGPHIVTLSGHRDWRARLDQILG
jgi:tRNA threonylcarbamoyladenosine biosynthesis protein TsaE